MEPLAIVDLFDECANVVTRVHVAEALPYRRIVPGRNALLVGA